MTLPNADERPSVLEAYDAMRAFLHAFWERGERSSEDLAMLLSSTQRSDASTFDPAQWYDWLSAVEAIRGRKGGGP